MIFFGAADSDIASNSGVLLAIDTVRGLPKWTPIKTQAIVQVQPSIHATINGQEDFVLFSSVAGDVHCVDFASGMLLWNYSTANTISTAPKEVDSNDMFYVGSGPTVLALDI